MLKIGLTGGIGSGKSTVAKLLRAMNYPVYESDERAKNLLNNNTRIHQLIEASFGDEVFDNFGKPVREKLAEKVFSNPSDLEKLNAIIHPAVREDFIEWSKKQNSNIIFKEAAIIFEHGLEKDLDEVWVVDAPETTRIERVMARSNITETQIRQRMKNQLNPHVLLDKADRIITNDEHSALIPQVLKAIRSLSI
ncbi:MAG: dephospho-CoA kinase [Bacteroidia bacterium]